MGLLLLISLMTVVEMISLQSRSVDHFSEFCLGQVHF